MTHTVA